MCDRIRLNLVNPRVLKITVTYAVCTLRCWTLPLWRFEREKRFCLRYCFAQEDFKKSPPFRTSAKKLRIIHSKINGLTSISSHKTIKLPKNFTCGHSSHVIPLTETVRYYLMHDHAILRDTFFGCWQLRAKMSSKPISFERFTFNFLKYRPVTRKDTVSLRFTSLSFPSKKIVLWEACAYWQWIVSGNDKGQWPVPMTWRRCFSMFTVCYFFIPVLLGIVFLCCKVFYIVKVGSSTLLEDLSFRHPFVLVVGVADIHVAWLVYVAY